MLNPQTAQAQLRSLYVEDWVAQRAAQSFRLGGALSGIAYAILQCNSQGKPIHDWQTRQHVLNRRVPQFEALSAGDRRQVLNTLFPRLAPYVELAWEHHLHLPYQGSAGRKAFRAPNSPDVSQWIRFHWLQNLAQAVGGYEQDIAWFAAWAPYLRWWGAPDALGILFSAAIDAGDRDGDTVFDILVASAQGEHEVGSMGRHVTRGLLVASRSEGWDFIEKLLLAAQRQEGLRQAILETVDEAHPEAFCRMLRLILEHDLTRFSATIRAADVWFGLGWTAAGAHAVKETIQQALYFLQDSAAREQALQADDHQALYLALWALAFEDVTAAVEPAARLLNDPCVERRFVATHLLGYIGLDSSRSALLSALEDDDLRVTVRALNALSCPDESLARTDLFERTERVLERLPRRKRELEPIAWPWFKLTADPKTATATLMQSLGNRSPKRLIPHLSLMDANDRAAVVRQLVARHRRDAEVRDTLLSLVGDRSRWVREQALQALPGHSITEQEAADLEGLLTRKAGDLRRGVLGLLLGQTDRAALASAERLLGASHAQQRLAGLDLLYQMTQNERSLDRCRMLAAQFRASRQTLLTDEENLLSLLLDQPQEPPTLDNALGLMDPADRTPAARPRAPKKGAFLSRQKPLVTQAAISCLKDLDTLIHHQRTTPITFERWDGTEHEELLGNLKWGFPMPKPELTPAEDRLRLPLREVWEKWHQERPRSLCDRDGLELLRALASCSASRVQSWSYLGFKTPYWIRQVLDDLFALDKRGDLQYPHTIVGVLHWLVRLYPVEGSVACLLDGVEATLAAIPERVVQRHIASNESDWRLPYGGYGQLCGWLDLAHRHRTFYPDSWQDEHHNRLWRLVRWLDEPRPGTARHRPSLEDVLFAFRAGGATEADLVDHLLGPRQKTGYGRTGFSSLHSLSGRTPHPLTKTYPPLGDLVQRCRERILDVELVRGEMPTQASAAALSLRYAGGTQTLVRILQAMGRDRFVRGWIYDSKNKGAVFSHLIRTTSPQEGDTVEAFRSLVEAAHIPEKRLVELAVYAPQWARHVERALQWPGVADAVWWIHAHTKDTSWRVEKEIRDMWNAQISEYTPLSGAQLLDGAVDVQWFSRAYRAIGRERWDRLYLAAKYASGGGGHKRAQLFADAMLGRAEKVDLVARIREKRHKDTVRALGLLPLADGEERTEDMLARYRTFQEFLRTSRRFGSQRQASEKLAVEIGMENMARTAGYPDPVRLQWAMEAEETADLAGSGQVVTAGETTITLAIDHLGEPKITVVKKGRTLRNIPAALRKDPRIVDLRGRRRLLKRQASRMRRSLEQAMNRGDGFTAADLEELLTHPLLAAMLRQLVFIGETAIGYPADGGTALQMYDGTRAALDEEQTVCIAHPYDLYTRGQWHMWQQDCYWTGRIQPFKQVFRELYLLTDAERTEGTVSRRYAGHQVNPRQALALLGQRRWVSHPEEGVRRTFHDEGITAGLTFLQGFYTPAEVEGLTLEGVQFVRRGEWKPLSLAEVPPRLFSEVMRDLDLVVSVAHQGGVDPEASASTVEMRASLLRETCAMLQIANVKLEGRYALIEGSLSSYNVHLGSAVVHQQPGGAICIVPVHAQHRGRLFLPFVDDDPKTAEVVSKVLLLAEDQDIQDPTILEQILHRR
jgi:HEAT repeat protein